MQCFAHVGEPLTEPLLVLTSEETRRWVNGGGTSESVNSFEQHVFSLFTQSQTDTGWDDEGLGNRVAQLKNLPTRIF